MVHREVFFLPYDTKRIQPFVYVQTPIQRGKGAVFLLYLLCNAFFCTIEVNKWVEVMGYCRFPWTAMVLYTTLLFSSHVLRGSFEIL